MEMTWKSLVEDLASSGPWGHHVLHQFASMLAREQELHGPNHVAAPSALTGYMLQVFARRSLVKDFAYPSEAMGRPIQKDIIQQSHQEKAQADVQARILFRPDVPAGRLAGRLDGLSRAAWTWRCRAPANVWSGTSERRCLVVDCGGVTNADSGLKEAVRKRVPEDSGDAAAKAAKKVWAAHREDPEVEREAWWAEVCEAAGLDPSLVPELEAEVAATLRTSYPETLELLRRAKEKGIVLGVVSNHLSFLFKECAEAAGFAELVPGELVVVSSEVACSKPGVKIFEVFLERLAARHPELSAGDCVFVDDKEENVAAAASLGFKGICYNARKAAAGDLERALRDLGMELN